MALGTGKRPNCPKPEPEDKDFDSLIARFDSKNLKPEPRKTWLDECAMMAMQAIISSGASRLVLGKGDDPDDNDKIAIISFQLADSMLAEKMKREAKE